MTNQQNKTYAAIDEILWFDWDPIGINNVAPRDEYQSYTQTIFGLKLSQASVDIIAQKLYDIETNTIGIYGDFERCREIAKKIHALK